MSYSITLEDIGNYLDSKQDDEVIGRACNSMRCIAAQALIQKYHLHADDVSVDTEAATIFKENDILARVDFSEEIITLVERFDSFPVGHNVTKREWLAREAVAG